MTTMLKTMIDRYNDAAFTHNYIWGFTYKKVVYIAYSTEEMMPYICKIDDASRGEGMALRFCPKNDQKLLLMTSAKPLCSEKYFNELCNEKYINAKGKATKYNRGEVFEKLVTEYYGQIWIKDNVPFTKAGDIEVDGVAYQIKYQAATFCNEKSLANLTK